MFTELSLQLSSATLGAGVVVLMLVRSWTFAKAVIR